jgi:hypothetical protein
VSARITAAVASCLLGAACTTATRPPASGDGDLVGLKAIVYPVPPGGAEWYAQFLGEPARNPVLGETAFTVGDVMLALESQAAPGATLPVWEVAGIDAVFTRLLALGAEPVTGIQEIGDARVAVLRDPFGNLIGLMEGGALQQR